MQSSFIYNPDNTFDHAHAASIEQHDNKIYCAWYMYEEKEHVQGQICLSHYVEMNRNWSKGRSCFPIFEGASLGNPVIFSFENKLHMYFVKLETYWHDAQIYHAYLENEHTNVWSDPKKVNVPAGTMVRHRPIIHNDEIYIPAYDEKTMETVIFKSGTDLAVWSEFSRVEGNFIQGDIIKNTETEWQIFLRAAKDNNHVFRSISPNCGESWSLSNKTSLPCPLSGVAALRLSNGNILVCNNHTPEHKRTPLSFSLSENMGVVFDYGPWHIDDEDLELSYPSLLQDRNHNIHIVFTYNRDMIKHVMLPEDELLTKIHKEKN